MVAACGGDFFFPRVESGVGRENSHCGEPVALQDRCTRRYGSILLQDHADGTCNSRPLRINKDINCIVHPIDRDSVPSLRALEACRPWAGIESVILAVVAKSRNVR